MCLHYLVKFIAQVLSPYITYFSIQVVDFWHQIFNNCWENSFQQSTTVSIVFTDIHYIFFASLAGNPTVFRVFHLPAGWSASSQSSPDGQVAERSHTDFIQPSLWPPNSPDLNSVDYAIWGIMQERVYNKGKIANVEELRHRIVDEWERLGQRIMDKTRAISFTR